MRIQTNSLIDQYSLGRTQRSSHRYSGECMLIIICCAALDVWEIPAHPYFICSLGLHHCAFIIDHLEFFIIFSFSFVYITVIAIFFFFFFLSFNLPTVIVIIIFLFGNHHSYYFLSLIIVLLFSVVKMTNMPLCPWMAENQRCLFLISINKDPHPTSMLCHWHVTVLFGQMINGLDLRSLK